MAAKVYRVLHCDARPYADPERQCFREQGAPFGESSFKQLRSWLKRQGWHNRPGGRDICPDCWKAGHR